ncbi:DUF4332 domain-containing protein [Hyphomonas oceanitis]|uniref:DUF4332 domain-containing protein n=1 Tax=Hyphomonas oceanitis SCH89 TaxID=1280953 RepID=A0A059GBJ0_9PROT|nr:DUF4332 domain-containing protein [Hyphomonas oceanitis]KDA04191.1 hypothetical protein HOC_02616 [Hyphomonas oceanitis SCH89]
MSLLERVIRAHRCTSTHHHIAFNALDLMEGDEAERWKSLFLVHHEHLLKGAKAPDTTFKDFRNHVLHISEGEWGGARDKATEWYAKAVDLLARKKWSEAAYALGVLSHYYADPLQPFHTGQTEEEGAIHRAVEWSIAKSQAEIAFRIDTLGYPEIEVPDGVGFVSDMVRAGAERSHPHYHTFIDHYDLDVGVKDPPAGLDETMLEIVADLVAYATAGMAVLMSRAIAEAAVAPPKVNLTIQGYIETLDIPLRIISKKLADAGDRRQVERMYAEFQKTGKVVKTLPDDDKAIRKLHAKQVLRVPLKQLDAQELAPLGSAVKKAPVAAPKAEVPAPKPVAKQEPKPAPAPAAKVEPKSTPKPSPAPVAKVEPKPAPKPEAPKPLLAPEPVPQPVAEAAPEPANAPEIGGRGRLTRESSVVDAPSIGRKTAKRLGRAGITTVADLMDCDPDETAGLLNVHHIDAETLIDWQDQTRLMMDVPGLRVHDAQILVGAGIRSAGELAAASARDVFLASMDFLTSPQGERVLWEDANFEEDEVEGWISMAQASAA